jgi:hypothetical protein
MRIVAMAAGESITGGATAPETVWLCDRIDALEAALRTTAQRNHLRTHDFATNYDTCHDEVCAKAHAALKAEP